MKSINDILENNKDLLNDSRVKNLIEYCRDLEGDLMYKKQNEKYSKELILSDLVKDIYNSIKDIKDKELLNDRWPNEFDKVNYKDSIDNLKKYLESFSRDNNFSL